MNSFSIPINLEASLPVLHLAAIFGIMCKFIFPISTDILVVQLPFSKYSIRLEHA